MAQGFGISDHRMSAHSDRAWYSQWQRKQHATRFDYRHTLDNRNLVQIYETLNDVRLLNERIDRSRSLTLLEIGCATGDFYRYLKLTYPHVTYYGVDISLPAIERARAKYPEGHFLVTDPGVKIAQVFEAASGCTQAEIVYSKDVVHHQTRPLDLVSKLLQLASEATIFRCRTRDVGATEMDPSRSRQYHYDGWVPYIVLNLEELIDHIRQEADGCEVVVYRNHTVLGAQYGRFLPPECSLKKTGTAETSVGVFVKTNAPGRVTIQDRLDNKPNTTLDHKMKSLWRYILDVLLHHTAPRNA